MRITSRIQSPHRAQRRGSLMLEVVVATVLVGAAILLVAQSTRLWLAQQRLATQQRIALVEASNLLERLTAQPISPDEAATATLSDQALAQLPGAEVTVAALPQGTLTRVEVAIDWQLASGARSHAVTLVTWAHSPPAEEPAP